MILHDLYAALPMPLKAAAVAARGAREHAIRYGAEYDRTLALLRVSERWAEGTLRRYQRDRLATLLGEARAHTDHYADVLTADAARHAVETLDLSSLPILPKATLKEETARFHNRSRKTVTRGQTSGSTGSPLQIEYDRESVQQRFAFMHRQREWGGARPLGTSVRFSSHHVVPATRQRPPFWVANPADRQLLVSTYHMNDAHLGAIADRIEAFAPQVLDGYKSAIQVLARYLAQTGRQLPSLKTVITTAETLQADERAEIEAGTGVRVLDYYAASEGVPLIQQCAAGRYHLRPESGVFEFLDDDGRPVGPGETGEIVATSFAQWKMPLVRYRTGDLATLPASEPGPCPCGCVHPTVDKIEGRREDLIWTRDGRWIGMVNYRTLKTITPIAEAQIVQTAPDAFTLRLVMTPGATVDDVRPLVEKKFRGLLGYDAEMTLEPVDALPRGAGGKLRAVVRTFTPDAPGPVKSR